jgi:sulfite reductase alpha subunit-like flavoprotein
VPRAHAQALCDGAPFPTPCTVERALTCYVDLQAPPRRNLLRRLAEYAADRSEHAEVRPMGVPRTVSNNNDK